MQAVLSSRALPLLIKGTMIRWNSVDHCTDSHSCIFVDLTFTPVSLLGLSSPPFSFPFRLPLLCFSWNSHGIPMPSPSYPSLPSFPWFSSSSLFFPFCPPLLWNSHILSKLQYMYLPSFPRFSSPSFFFYDFSIMVILPSLFLAIHSSFLLISVFRTRI